MAEYKNLTFEIAPESNGFVGLLTVNRPQALNSLNREVIGELTALLTDIESSSLRCLILTGAGEKAFVAGADIKEMEVLDPDGGAAWSAEGNTVMEKLENLPMPVIAAVNGFALGGGCELALACDFRLASKSAQFSFPEVSLGIIPGYGGIQRLARSLGLARAKELIFTGRRVKAELALEWGLVNAVFENREALLAAALETAGKIAANAPLAVQKAKAVANESVGRTLQMSTQLETRYFAECFATQDQKEAMNAFTNKRQPAPFEGR